MPKKNENEVEGFEIRPYPNLETGADDDLYVCTVCVPQWDTFRREDAEAHTAMGQHQRLEGPETPPEEA